jgi:type I restriction enzyme, R subunit
VNEIYRLMKTGVAKRILFLVDRRALAAQAVRAFSSFDADQGLKFDQGLWCKLKPTGRSVKLRLVE